MKAELNFPQELIDEITDSLITKIKPLLKQNNDEADRIFNVNSLASYLNVSKKWVYERTHLREIPHYKFGNVLGFKKKEIDKWISTNSIPFTCADTPRLRGVL